MIININNSCLDCFHASWTFSICDWKCNTKLPNWEESFVDHNKRSISKDRPYIDCPAWKEKKSE